MTDQELRALVRDAIERHLGGGGRDRGPAPRPSTREPQAGSPPVHASHSQYLTLINVGDACLIEPAVGCNHCEYCRSHGH